MEEEGRECDTSSEQRWPCPPGIVPPTRFYNPSAPVDQPLNVPGSSSHSKGKGGGKHGGGDPLWQNEWQQGDWMWQAWDPPSYNGGRDSKGTSQRQQRSQRRQQSHAEYSMWGDSRNQLDGEDAWNMWQSAQQWDDNQSMPGQSQHQRDQRVLQHHLQVQLGLLEESIQGKRHGKSGSKYSSQGSHANSSMSTASTYLDEQRLETHAGSSSSSVSASKESQGLSNMSRLRRNKWINRQVTRIADTGNLQRLLQTVQFHIAEMNGINLATALHRVTKLVVSSLSGMPIQQLLRHPSFQLLRATVVQHIESHRPRGARQAGPHAQVSKKDDDEPVFEVQCMSIVCWSCATLRLHEEKLLETIADVVLPCLDELKPFELSNMLWAYAKLSLGKPSLLAAVSERMLNREWGEFSMQCLSMIAWSFATEKQRDLPVFTSIACEIVANASTTRPQEIANTLWAYAKNRCADVSLFNALAETAVSHNMLWSFKSQELSNTVWAFATIGLQHAMLFKHAVAVAISKRRELSPQNIANILWAYAKLQVCRRSGLFPALLAVSVGMMPQHKPHEISAIVWAAAKAEVKLDFEENYPSCRRFFNATAHMCRQRLHEFPPQALANMVEAFAIIEADFPSFSEAMARESVGRLHQFDAMALANLFRGVVLVVRRGHNLGTQEHERHLAVLAAIGAHVALRVHELQSGDMAHVEHSLQLLGPALRASSTGGLDQLLLRGSSRQSDQKQEKREGRHDMESFEPDDVDDEMLLGNIAQDLGGLCDEKEESDPFGSEFQEDFEDWSQDRPAQDWSQGRHNPAPWGPPGGKPWGPPGGKGPMPVWGPPGGKGQMNSWGEGKGEWSDSYYQSWPAGPKVGKHNSSGPSQAQWGPLEHEWNPWDQGFSPATSGFSRVPMPAGPAGQEPPGLSAYRHPPVYSSPVQSDDAMCTLAAPMQVGWQGNVHFDSFHGSAASQEGVSSASSWWKGQSQARQEFEDGQTKPRDPQYSHEAPLQGPITVSPQDIAVQSWKPRVVDVSCFVMMENSDEDPAERLHSWKPVVDTFQVPLTGTDPHVVHFRYGVVDDRVVVKRMAAGDATWPLSVAQSENVLAPLAVVPNPHQDNCYVAYSFCDNGSLDNWIADQKANNRPIEFPMIVQLLLGVLEAAAAFITCGVGINSIRADEIFLDKNMKPMVRLRHDDALLWLIPGFAASRRAREWQAPEELEVPSNSLRPAVWSSVVYRMGLLLYCLVTQTPDPWATADSSSELSVCPDLEDYTGPDQVRDIMESCWSSQASQRPDHHTLREKLIGLNDQFTA